MSMTLVCSMAHRDVYATGKTIRFKTDKPRHTNATPYKRPKHKIDYRDYDN